MPSYKIGVNFGTANSVVSYLEDGKLQVLEGGEGDEDIKVQRLLQASAYLSKSKEKSTSVSVQVESLRELLLSKATNRFSFSPQKGTIKSLVLSIPEAWYREIDSSARVSLGHSIARELEVEDDLVQLIREPVAAAAYWMWAMPSEKPRRHSNLLICDMGSSTFKVSLCRISMDNKVNVLYSDCQETAGFAFDRRCVEFAYAHKQRHPLTDDHPDFFRLMKDFEREKINTHEKATSRLMTYLKAPEAMADYDLYCFGGGYAVKCCHVREAFAPIELKIKDAIQRLNAWMQTNQQAFDYLLLIGGFSRFMLAQQTILQALDIQDNDPRVYCSLDDNQKLWAISHGACLIANRLVDPLEKSTHTLGIVGEPLNAWAEREQRLIPVVRSDTPLDDLSIARFPDNLWLTAFQEHLPTILLWIASETEGQFCREVSLDGLLLPNYSPENHWRVGMRLNPSGELYLVIEDEKENPPVEYNLGLLSEVVALPKQSNFGIS
jgi:molecular chaperone DnaK